MLAAMRRFRWMVWIAFLAIISSPAAFAQFGRRAIQAHGGYAFHEENNLRGGFESGFGFSYPLGKQFSLSFEFSHWQATSKESFRKLHNGRITVSPILICLQYEFLQNKFFFPYAFGGGAFVFARFKIGPYASIPEVKIEQKVEDGPGLYFGLGMGIALTHALNFFSEVSTLRRMAPAKTIITDMNLGTSTEEIVANLRTIFLKFGLKLFF